MYTFLFHAVYSPTRAMFMVRLGHATAPLILSDSLAYMDNLHEMLYHKHILLAGRWSSPHITAKLVL